MVDALNLRLSQREIDAIARLAQAEASSIYRQTGNPLAYQAVVDTVLNRVAAGGAYGDGIAGVMSAPKQFEPVTRYGGVDKLPQASEETRQIVGDYLKARAGGAPAAAGDVTHFLNPYVGYTGPAWKQWGSTMTNQLPLGTPGGAFHLHGRAQNTPGPNPYTVSIDQGAPTGIDADRWNTAFTTPLRPPTTPPAPMIPPQQTPNLPLFSGPPQGGPSDSRPIDWMPVGSQATTREGAPLPHITPDSNYWALFGPGMTGVPFFGGRS